MRQVKSLEQKEKELTAKIAANLKAGNRAVAGQMALELQTVKGQLEENREQLVTADETFKKLVKSRDVAVQEARGKIEKLKRMLSETEMLEAQAELQEMAAGMISEIGGSGDTLNRVEEYLSERRDKAAGRACVASTGIDIQEVELKEAGAGSLWPNRRWPNSRWLTASRLRRPKRPPRGGPGRSGARAPAPEGTGAAGPVRARARTGLRIIEG